MQPSTEFESQFVVGVVGDRQVFLGSPKAAAEMFPLSAEAQGRIGTLQDDGKTVSVLVMDG